MDIRAMCKSYLPKKICGMLLSYDRLDDINEVRLRLKKPLCVRLGGGESFIGENGECTPDAAYLPSRQDIDDAVALISDYSLYAFAGELKNGYITLKGGFRVGIVGQAVCHEGSVTTIRNISALNYRISRQVIGCGQAAADRLYKNGIGSTLIVSPPGCGKTTLLRDLIRILSGRGYTAAVADERGEIAGSYMGEQQLDLGIRTDVLEDCPKAAAINMLLRSMSPDIIAADEIGSDEDKRAIEDAVKCGTAVFCTAHGGSVESLCRRRVMQSIVNEKIFDYYIFLKNGCVGIIEKILDKELNEICF